MKKIFGIFVVAAMMSTVACGPSEKETKARDEKLKRDSDSIADALTKQMYAPSKDSTKKDAGAPADTTKK
jgi:hypothetical protein